MIFAMQIFTIILVMEQEKQRIKVFKLIQDRNQYHGKIHVGIVTLKCMLQKSAVDGMFLQLINQHNFPLHFHLETPQNLLDQFPLFFKKLLNLNPTICKHPILSNTNHIFFLSYSRRIMKFLYQLNSGVYLMLILFFYL